MGTDAVKTAGRYAEVQACRSRREAAGDRVRRRRRRRRSGHSLTLEDVDYQDPRPWPSACQRVPMPAGNAGTMCSSPGMAGVSAGRERNAPETVKRPQPAVRPACGGRGRPRPSPARNGAAGRRGHQPLEGRGGALHLRRPGACRRAPRRTAPRALDGRRPAGAVIPSSGSSATS